MGTPPSTDKQPGVGIRAILRLPLLTVGLWVVLGGLGMVFLPSVDHVVASQSNGSLPSDAPTLRALEDMDRAFGTGRAKAFVFVVLENDDGLRPADEASYAALVSRLRSHPDNVAEVQDYLTDEDKREALTSKDGRATYLPVGLTASFGSSASNDQVLWVRDQVRAVTKGSGDGTKAYVTGDPANLIDMTTLATSANEMSGIFSMILLFVILLLIYRRWMSIVVPLVTIGVATLCTNSVLSLAGQAGMGLSTYTESFCVAIVLGAGTDYSIFLISRFREEYARTGDVRSAVTQAMTRIGPALIASAGTVAISSMVLNFAQLSVFRTTGPAMAVAVVTTALIALTVTPAMLLVVGQKIGPAPVTSPTSFWSRVGAYVALKPTRILIGGTAVLIALMAIIPTVTLGYAEHPADPRATESASGQKVLDDHFGTFTTQPDYVLINADHDMRNSRDLAVLAAASRDVAKIDSVASVSSAAQPGGEPLEDTRITSQIGKVASNLRKTQAKVDGGKGDLIDLAGGTGRLANGADQQAAGLAQAVGSMPRIISGMARLTAGTAKSAGGAQRLANAADKVRSGLRDLAHGLDSARAGASRSTDSLGQALSALEQDPYCDQSPTCPQARQALAQIYQAQRSEMVPGLARSASAASRLASGEVRLIDGMHALARGLTRSVGGHADLAHGQRSLYGGMSQLASGSRQLADGLDKLPSGVKQVVDSTLQLAHGIGDTGQYLSEVSAASDTADAGGFYLPPSALESTSFSNAVKQFLSPDGRTARIAVLGSSSPSSAGGLDRYEQVQDRVEQALAGTTLDGSTIQATGAAGGAADLRDYFKADFKLVLLAVLLTVLVLMMVVLRSVVAPVYLLVSVILSYGAALGATVLLFHTILGQVMPFNVPVLSFVLLVAVGADYNILLMSRMREKRGRLTPRAVGEAVTATGPVITSAGIIFASAFLPMVASTLSAVAQLCFAVVIGLLLDTFVVRTLIVPACAALLGERSWWPGRTGVDAPPPEVTPDPGVWPERDGVRQQHGYPDEPPLHDSRPRRG